MHNKVDEIHISVLSSDGCSSDIAVEHVEEVVDVKADHRLVALEEARQFLLEAHVELVDPRVAVPVALGDAAAARSQVRIALDELVERGRSEEHTSELQSLMRISYAVFCLKKKK